jgi:hypothetical protein
MVIRRVLPDRGFLPPSWMVTGLLPLDVVDDITHVNTSRDEFRTSFGQLDESPFPAPVDRRDVVEIDNALQVLVGSMSLFPASSQLANPQPLQPALESPFLFCCRLGPSDLQHINLGRLAN